VRARQPDLAALEVALGETNAMEWESSGGGIGGKGPDWNSASLSLS